MHVFRIPLFFITFILATASQAQGRRVIIWGHPEDGGKKFAVDSLREFHFKPGKEPPVWYAQWGDSIRYDGVIRRDGWSITKGDSVSLAEALTKVGLYWFDPRGVREPGLIALGIEFDGKRKDAGLFDLLMVYKRE